MLELLDSQWSAELKKVLSRKDETATFMDKARHFVVPLGDNVLEVIAWQVHTAYLEER